MLPACRSVPKTVCPAACAMSARGPMPVPEIPEIKTFIFLLYHCWGGWREKIGGRGGENEEIGLENGKIGGNWQKIEENWEKIGWHSCTLSANLV